jgi:hypothetical protein
MLHEVCEYDVVAGQLSMHISSKQDAAVTRLHHKKQLLLLQVLSKSLWETVPLYRVEYIVHLLFIADYRRLEHHAVRIHYGMLSFTLLLAVAAAQEAAAVSQAKEHAV